MNKRTMLRLAASACIAAGAFAIGPAAGATEAPVDLNITGGTECRNPSVSWEAWINPPHLQVDADPGRICLYATTIDVDPATT